MTPKYTKRNKKKKKSQNTKPNKNNHNLDLWEPRWWTEEILHFAMFVVTFITVDMFLLLIYTCSVNKSSFINYGYQWY